MFLESLDEKHVGCASALGEADELDLVVFDIGSELMDFLAHSIDACCVVEASWAVWSISTNWLHLLLSWGHQKVDIIFFY